MSIRVVAYYRNYAPRYNIVSDITGAYAWADKAIRELGAEWVVMTHPHGTQAPEMIRHSANWTGIPTHDSKEVKP